jgi:hypothetical protein
MFYKTMLFFDNPKDPIEKVKRRLDPFADPASRICGSIRKCG